MAWPWPNACSQFVVCIWPIVLLLLLQSGGVQTEDSKRPRIDGNRCRSLRIHTYTLTFFISASKASGDRRNPRTVSCRLAQSAIWYVPIRTRFGSLSLYSGSFLSDVDMQTEVSLRRMFISGTIEAYILVTLKLWHAQCSPHFSACESCACSLDEIDQSCTSSFMLRVTASFVSLWGSIGLYVVRLATARFFS